MQKEKIAYKHKKMKLMNKTTFFVSLLIVAALVFSSTIPAINLPSQTMKTNEKIQEEDIPSTGLPPVRSSIAPSSISQNIGSSGGNIAPLERGFNMYGWGLGSYPPNGAGTYYWDSENPGDLILISNEQLSGGDFCAGGTWTCDGRWLCSSYTNGDIFEVDPETGELNEIGGGGVGLNGLEFDPSTNQLYGASGSSTGSALYLINQETGVQDLIGSMGFTYCIALACNKQGDMYGWSISPDALFSIDKETGQGTQIGTFSQNLNYAQDGFFDGEGTLWMTLETISYIGYLYTCNPETAELTLVGTFENNCLIDGSMCMYTCIPPEHDVGVKSIDKPADGYALPIINPEVTVKNFGNNSEYTDVQFEIIKCEAGPTLHEQNFTGSFPPAGWTHLGYKISNTNKAGGTSPEASYTYSSPYVSYGWLMSPAVNATGFEKINVIFRMLCDKSDSYSPFFYLQYRKNATSPWRDVSPWTNPLTADLGPAYYLIGCYGWGEDIGGAFQVRWYWGSYYYYLQSGSGIYIDDVEIQGCAGCAEYADLTEDVFIEKGQQLSVSFGDWTPSEWHNESYQNTWEDYPLTSYTMLDGDQDARNNKKQRLLHLYYPWLHDVGAMTLSGPASGPAQTFPVKTTIKNVGQYDECCFKTYAEIAEIDTENPTLLLSQNFASCSPWPPTGWTRTHTNWGCSYSAYAGGTSPEARFYWSPSSTSKFRFVSPPINTVGYGQVKIDFRHSLNHFSGPYTIKVETSQDKISWTTVWQIVNPTSFSGTPVSILTADNVGKSTFYVSWTFDGNSYNTNYWYVDNIVINGLGVKTPEYTDYYCVSTLAVGEEKSITFEDWTPKFLAEETTGKRIYLAKVYTDLLEPLDNNKANDAYNKQVTLDFFHDVAIEVAAPLDRGIKLLWDNGDTDGSNGYSVLGNPQRRLLDDFELTSAAKISEIQCLFVAGTPTDFEVRFRPDDNKKPSSTIFATSVDIKTTCKATGRTWFGYPEQLVTYDFQPIKLSKGIWWVEGWTSASAPNMFWMIHAKLWREECWCNYADYGFRPGSQQFGVKADLAFKLFGSAGAEVYVPAGDQDIDALASNIGTFPEKAMTCYADIYEFYTDCENGTLAYAENITDIDILTPLTGTKLLNFKNYDFAVEGLYRLDLNLVDDNDDYISNNTMELMIGCDDTPAATTYALNPPAPDGLNGWYISDVEITLTATDPGIGCDSEGSGVEQIKYQVDGGAVESLPGDTGSFVVTTDSTMHTIKYWSIDNVGNQESQKTIQFKQDQTPPKIEHTYEFSGEAPLWNFTFTANATDATSGMQRVEFWLNSELEETIVDSGPLYIWEIPWSPVPKAIFRAIAYDFAGLSAYDDVIDPKLSKNSVSKSISANSKNSMRLPLSK